MSATEAESPSSQPAGSADEQAAAAAAFGSTSRYGNVLAFRRCTDFHVDLPSELEPGVSLGITHVVHGVFDHLTGAWSVTVRRTPERGRWRLELQGATGRHIWTFLAGEAALPEMIDRKLKTFVRVASTKFQIREIAARRA